MMCDSGTKYMINAMPYIGNSTLNHGWPLGEYYVKELSRLIHGINRIVTCDNWFTSVPLAKALCLEPCKFDTPRYYKREIPEEMRKTLGLDKQER